MKSNTLPPHTIVKNVPERREPGTIIFNVRPGGSADLTGQFGWVMGIDRDGQIAFNWEFDEQPQDTCGLPNGNVLFSLTKAGALREATRNGELVKSWHLPALLRGKQPPNGSTAVDIPLFHHRTNVFPSGNFLLLSAEARLFENWALKDDVPDPPRGPAKVIGDVIYEVSPLGKVLHQWSILDMLDPYRMCYGSCSPYWRQRGFPDSFDWCHANAAAYDASDDSIIVSLRTQDCIIKFSRSTGELLWILGDHGNWKSPWKEKLLRPVGTVDWQYHQHDCTITPKGTILCFDNGNLRATPFQKRMAAEESYSRAVEFRVDPKAMTVSQVWSYGEGSGERLFACYQGGAYRLPKTGNTIITYGGIATIDGVPTNRNLDAFCTSRIIEVTPQKDIVFDLVIADTSKTDPVPLSSFRADFLPD